ncbi:MAG TPA: multicopper oxidase domain-containing protein [Kofleriaceae bacterium]|jgi:FtsP/CotA-like multicopper oxidase with cupredoxin domain|nr:multicopper oxidase domain-containing protein [Kofleriaceae bacterium]
MRTCEGTRYVSDLLTRAASLGLAGVAALGCTATDEPLRVSSTTGASELVAQTPLDGGTIPKYVDRLPTLGSSRVDGTRTVNIDMHEFQQKLLPASVYASLPAPFNAGTFVWGYQANNGAPQFPSQTIEARQGTTTSVVYANKLQGRNGGPPFLQKYLTQDLTIHWADPTHVTANNHCAEAVTLSSACSHPSMEPIPTVPHLHGAEVLSAFDGHPDAWFTPSSAMKGPAFVSNTYNYVNTQEATTLWFHDHSLGTTRLNVYSGMAGFYLIRDGRDTGAANNPIGLPAGAFEQELMIADRQFDTQGQLLFPDGTPPDNPTGINGGPPNPDTHPFWIPEFFGDVMTVNGKSWPFFEVQPRRYRFRVVNASNARFIQAQLVQSNRNHQPTTTAGPDLWQIGSDGGFLNAPTDVDAGATAPHLFLAPAERADIIVDFSGQSGKNFILINGQGAFAPYPSGDPPDPNTSGQIMEFRVNQALQGTDTSFNPAHPQRALRAAPIVDIKPADTHRTPDKNRQLILVEVEGDGGPLEVMLNNSHWNGNREGTTTQIPGSMSNGHGISATEVPRVGSTELWQIANLTEDAHPIHIHLIQFQVISRQNFRRDDYRAAWDATFPGGTFNGVTYPAGTFIPGFGPPTSYTTPNAAGAVGGNLAFNSFLTDSPVPPTAEEGGWKDTLKILPFEVTTVAIRWAPTTTAVSAVSAGVNKYAFDPTSGGPGYVWHCHILDHEDNEMMRSFLVGR